MVQRWSAAGEECRQGGTRGGCSDLRENTRLTFCLREELYLTEGIWVVWLRCMNASADERRMRRDQGITQKLGGKRYYLEMLKSLGKSVIQGNNTLVKSYANPCYSQSLFAVQSVKYNLLRYIYSRAATTGSYHVWWVCIPLQFHSSKPQTLDVCFWRLSSPPGSWGFYVVKN